MRVDVPGALHVASGGPGGRARRRRHIFLSAGIGDYRLTIPAGPEANATLFCPAQPPAPSNCPSNRTGDLDISTNVHLNGIGPDSSVIDGANINRIFDVHAGGTLWLTDVTLQNGKADFDEATYHEHGGAIHNHGTLILDRVAVINSSSTSASHAWGGGGITNAGEAQLSNVTVARNSTDAQGGGIENKGELRTLNVTITENSAPQNAGRRDLLRHGTRRADDHGGRHRGYEPPGRGLLGQAKDHLLRGQLRERRHLPISCLHGPPQGSSPISTPPPSARRCSTRCCPRAMPSTEISSASTTTSAVCFVRWTATATASRAATAAPTSSSRAGRPRCSFAACEPERARSGAERIHVTIWLSARSKHTVTVRATTKNGTARAGSDFVAKSVKLTFRPNQRHKRFTVAVIGDRERERNETFKVQLSAAKGAPIADANATVTIVGDD